MSVGAPLVDGFLEATNPASFARGKEVFLYERGTKTPAQLYADEALTEPIGQPLITDKGGRPRTGADQAAWVAVAPYDLEIDGEIVPWNPPGGEAPDLSGLALASEIAELDTDAAMTANGDSVVASQKATKTLIEATGKGALRSAWRPAETDAETYPRAIFGDMKNLSALTSGTLYVVGGMVLPKGEPVGAVHFYSATTAGVELTHQWGALMDASRKVLAISADKTTEAWGANSKKTFTLEAGYTATEDKPLYLGLLVVAVTVPTLRGRENENTFPGNQAPIICGTSNTGLTVPSGLTVGSTANALTATNKQAYGTVA